MRKSWMEPSHPCLIHVSACLKNKRPWHSVTTRSSEYRKLSFETRFDDFQQKITTSEYRNLIRSSFRLASASTINMPTTTSVTITYASFRSPDLNHAHLKRSGHLDTIRIVQKVNSHLYWFTQLLGGLTTLLDFVKDFATSLKDSMRYVFPSHFVPQSCGCLVNRLLEFILSCLLQLLYPLGRVWELRWY